MRTLTSRSRSAQQITTAQEVPQKLSHAQEEQSVKRVLKLESFVEQGITS